MASGIVAGTEILKPDLKDGFLDATSLAEYLTSKSIPFREAHGIVGKIVAYAETNGISLSEIPRDELEKLCTIPCPDVEKHLGAENVVASYSPAGAGGKTQLSQQLEYWNKKLS